MVNSNPVTRDRGNGVVIVARDKFSNPHSPKEVVPMDEGTTSLLRQHSLVGPLRVAQTAGPLWAQNGQPTTSHNINSRN